MFCVMSDNLLEQLPELIDAGHFDRLLGAVWVMDGGAETDDREVGIEVVQHAALQSAVDGIDLHVGSKKGAIGRNNSLRQRR